MSAISVQITADVADLVAKLAVAKAEVSSANTELRAMAQQMAAAGNAASADLKSGLASAAQSAAAARAEMAALNTQMKEAQAGSGGLVASFKNMLEPITSIQSALRAMGEALIAAFAVERLASWDEQTAEAGAHMAHLAEQVGLTVEQFSGLSAAFGAMGLGGDQAASMIERLEKNMIAAESGTGKQAAAFRALGIGASELKNLSIDEVLNRMADAFKASADGPEKTAIAIALMGRAGAEMIPFLDRGREGLEEFKKRAEETGTVISGPMAEGMEKTTIGFSTLGLASKGLGISLFEVFKPATDAIVKGLTAGLFDGNFRFFGEAAI